jgi:hypothetical protein
MKRSHFCFLVISYQVSDFWEEFSLSTDVYIKFIGHNLKVPCLCCVLCYINNTSCCSQTLEKAFACMCTSNFTLIKDPLT